MLGSNGRRLEALQLESSITVANTNPTCITGLCDSLRHLVLSGVQDVQHAIVTAMLHSRWWRYHR